MEGCARAWEYYRSRVPRQMRPSGRVTGPHRAILVLWLDPSLPTGTAIAARCVPLCTLRVCASLFPAPWRIGNLLRKSTFGGPTQPCSSSCWTGQVLRGLGASSRLPGAPPGISAGESREYRITERSDSRISLR